MGESKSPALPLGDGASSLFFCSHAVGGPSGHLILKGYHLILAELAIHVKEKQEDSS